MLLNKWIAAFAVIFGMPAQAGENGQVCNVLDIPQCIGWTIYCPSHAPDFSLRFRAGDVDVSYLTGVNFNTETTSTTSYSSTTSTVSGQPVTDFTTALGVGGQITVLQNPTCSDGHFFDAAPFELEVTTVPAGVSIAPGAKTCCVMEPQQ